MCIADLARNAAAARGVWHQYAVAACERQVCGQRSAFVAAFFLDHLHQDDLAPFDDFLDFVGAPFAPAALRNFLERIDRTDRFDLVAAVLVVVRIIVRAVVIVVCGGLFRVVLVVIVVGGFEIFRRAVAVCIRRCLGNIIDIVVVVVTVGGFLLDEGLPVRKRDLIVVGVDFVERQKAVTVTAIVDEGRLKGRFYTRHLGKIDVASELFSFG